MSGQLYLVIHAQPQRFEDQTNISFTQTRPGDIVISGASGLIKAIGLVAAPYSDKSNPSEFGSAGEP